MDIISQYYRAYQTVLEMIEDRNYIVPEEYKAVDNNTFKYLYTNSKLDIFVKDHNNSSSKLFAKFIQMNKVKPNFIRELILKIKEEFLTDENDKLLIILKNKPNNSILKIPKENKYNFCQIFWINNLQFNITKHDLVPKHVKLDEKEVIALLNKYSLKNRSHLPVICKEDPIIKYFDISPNSVVKITRPSRTMGNYEFYRCVR